MTGIAPVAIVTGGSGGLAPGIVRALAETGATVVITARREDRLAETARQLADAGTVIPMTSDATDSEAILRFVTDVRDRFGRIDILVNAAASSTPIGGAVETVNVDVLMRDVDTKVGGYLRYIRAVVPVMKAQGEGRIINIGGLTGRSSDTLSGLRNVAVSHLTKVFSDQLAPFGLSVNAVHPGIVATPHLAELFGEMAEARGVAPQEIEAEFTAEIPARRMLTPDEVGRAVLFLAQAKPHWINGESITVDGGYSRGVFL